MKKIILTSHLLKLTNDSTNQKIAITQSRRRLDDYDYLCQSYLLYAIYSSVDSVFIDYFSGTLQSFSIFSCAIATGASSSSTGSNKRSFISCGEEDRLSNLPEDLIATILERIRIQDAAKTSIISKKWRYIWTTIRMLVFDDHFFKKFAKNGAFGRNGYIRIINKVLNLHKGPIPKFYINLPNMSLDSFDEVDQWMLLLSNNGVRELVLTNSSQCYKLPSYVFSCLELTKLKLQNCFFKPPLEFGGFINLTYLSLKYIDFAATLCETQFNLPQLNMLHLETCKNVHNFNIKATKLQTLYVFNCPDVMLLRLLHSPCLAVFSITFRKPIEDNVQVERMTLDMMLSNLLKIEWLYLDGRVFKVLIAEKIPKWLPHAVNSLKHLGFIDFELGDVDQLHGALCLLRNSPNLESLSVICLMTKRRVDMGPASNHLEAPNCLDHTLDKLQSVFITCLEGSRPQLLFIKLLLAHSPSLEKLGFAPSATFDVQKRFDIAKEVMRFPRSSPKAKVDYFDPERLNNNRV